MKLLKNALLPVIFKFVLISITLAQDIAPDSCSQYSLGLCIRCVIGTHLYNGLCYTNILGCLNYAQGGVCSSCEAPNFQLFGNTCILTQGAKIVGDVKTNLYKYGGNTQDPGANYGEAGFIPTNFETVRTWPTFIALNTFIRAGTYAHFISRTGNPVYSVHYYIQNNIYSYKILYDGSGGGLFLCIADVPPNFQVRLRSLTPISASIITDKCVDYDVNSRCLRCASGYHLQNSKCYENFGGCVLYRQNICLRCLDYFFLVQNRCVSDCLSVSDARSIFYYNGSKFQSTFQAFYQVSSSQFYTVEIRNTATPTPITITTSVPIILPTNLETTISTTSVFNTVIDSRSTSTETVSNSNSESLNIIGGNSNNGNNIITFNRTTTTIQSTSSTNLPLQAPQNSLNQNTISQTSGGITILNTTNIQIDSTLDPNCAGFDNYKKCTKCAPYFYQNKDTGRCTAVSPFCSTYSEDNGECLTCFPRFKLQKGDCFIAQ